MQVTPECIKLIKDFEGCKLKAYQDLGHVWTIGYGCTQGVKQGQEITESQAEILLLNAISEIATDVKKCLKHKLEPNQFSAVVALVYNIGISNFRFSMLKRCLDVGNLEGAASEFMKWNKVDGREIPGLTRRRMAERQLFSQKAINYVRLNQGE